MGQTVALTAPTRDFGYFVGDVIVTEAVVTTPGNVTIDRQSLPVPGPLNASIELRRLDISETLVKGFRKTILRLEYQSFFAPEQVMQAELPAYDIRVASSVVHVPAWPFHVSPLRVAKRSVDDLADLRGDLAVPQIPQEQAFAGLLGSTALALASAAVFAGVQGWLPGLGRKTKPFAMAARRISRLTPPETERALRALLHAFDATDGRNVFAEDLDAFLQRHPSFGDLREKIVQFFDLSRRSFFARPQPEAEYPQDFAAIAALAKALRQAERRW
jgi:mxaA protein